MSGQVMQFCGHNQNTEINIPDSDFYTSGMAIVLIQHHMHKHFSSPHCFPRL